MKLKNANAAETLLQCLKDNRMKASPGKDHLLIDNNKDFTVFCLYF